MIEYRKAKSLIQVFSHGGIGAARKAHMDGTHRLISPEDTLARVQPFMTVMGITRVANVTGLDIIGIPVVMVCRPNSRSISVSQGKGHSLAAAKASGVMESIESYHAERITLPLKLASYEELRYTHPVIDVEGLPRLSNSTFTPFTSLLWIEGYELLNDRPIWAPNDMVCLNYTLPLPTGHGCFLASSSGLASGNHYLEAVSHGICEVIERDSTTLWHCLDEDAQDQTRVDLETIEDPRCLELLEMYKLADVKVAVWDTTSDIGIPTFLCRALQRKSSLNNTYRPAAGMGCHPSREVALLRALSEAAQSRLTFISGARDDMPREEYIEFLDPQTHEAWLTRMERGAPVRNFSHIPTWQAKTFEDDVNWEIERLATVGVEEVVVVDLTKLEFEIPVVRVIIPGLESLNHSPKYVFGSRARAQLKNAA